MFKSQQKEYELLKKDITDIKKYINDYVGYIIGTNGIAFALFAYLSLDESSSFDAKFITLFLGIVILFLLYSVVIYKFNSHNKLAGYIRLLTQEIDYIDLNKTNSVRVSSSVEYDGTFISWEFIMSKWDALISRKNCPKHSFNNLNFHFQPKETDLKIDKKTNNDEKRYSYFTNKENSVLIKKIQNKFLCKLVFENYPKLSNIFQVFFRKNKLYSKYKMSSWKYPKVIFLIFSTLYFFFLLTLIFLILLTHYKTLTNDTKPFFILWYYTFPILFSFGLYVYLFLKEYVRVLRKDKSVDFYCWAFLPFRVQLLNQYDFIPIYYATYFSRYKGSLSHLEYIEQQTIDTEFVRKLIQENDFFKNLDKKQQKQLNKISKNKFDFDKNDFKLKIEKGLSFKNNSIEKILLKYAKYKRK